jgi:hypothetical protein
MKPTSLILVFGGTWSRKIRRTLAHLVAAGALMLAVGSAGSAQAPAPAPGPGRGIGPAARLPRQGFEATGQSAANYTPEEAAAVAVIQKWIDTTNNQDLAGHMALIDDNVVFRPDPTAALSRGARGYCAAYGFVRSSTSFMKLDELYVVGGPSDTLVLIKRTNINGTGMYTVPLAVFARVKNGKITEWYDAPLNKVSGGARQLTGAVPPPAQPAQPRNIPAACMPYPEGSQAPAPPQAQTQNRAQAPTPAQTPARAPTYGTFKPEFWFNPEEESAAQTVRAWFASWKAGDALLLGAFVDEKVIFRANPAADLGHGRDNLMRMVCGYTGGRLNLTGLFVVGGDYDAGVLTSWDKYDARGNRTRMGSLFRVQKGLIVEWMDTALDAAGPAAAANQNSEACQAMNAALTPAAAAPAR